MKKSPTRFIRRVDNKFTSASLDLNFQNMTTSGFDSRITFTRASSGTYFDGSGILQTASTNVPRLDHSPTTRLPLGLLIEEQRTNLILQSEDFSTTWTNTNSSEQTNVIVAPNGTLTGDKLVEDTANGVHDVLQSITLVASTTYSLSVFAKAAERTRFRVAGRIFGSWSAFPEAVFDLSTGTVVSGTGTITAVGNGWYRCSVVGTTSATNAGINIALVSTGTTISYTGDGTSGIYLWGAQLEAGAFPTSYIPTTVAAATRNADVATMTGTNFSSWYNATEGTVFADYIVTTATKNCGALALSDGGNNNRMIIRASNTSTQTVFIGVDNTATQWSIVLANAPLNTLTKSIFGYKVNDIAVVRGGGSVTTDQSATIPTVNQLRIGADGDGTLLLNGTISRIAYYPVRLSNDQLQALTR